MASIIFLGFMLTSVVMVQYQYVIFLMRGMAGRSPAQFLITPIAWGVMCGTGFGIYENFCFPQ